ncbi:hypothetical protein CRE_25830 [Caenorhabditis remanei]|uniref:Uncharacterized protein n=1 Tax=Caenorhabditis remanei TaxID=31234 RepID=E3NAB2_CAERE|nr:hypothetical protein CRE_25830 [Caenorhabditis remanei]
MNTEYKNLDLKESNHEKTRFEKAVTLHSSTNKKPHWKIGKDAFRQDQQFYSSRHPDSFGEHSKSKEVVVLSYAQVERLTPTSAPLPDMRRLDPFGDLLRDGETDSDGSSTTP